MAKRRQWTLTERRDLLAEYDASTDKAAFLKEHGLYNSWIVRSRQLLKAEARAQRKEAAVRRQLPKVALRHSAKTNAHQVTIDLLRGKIHLYQTLIAELEALG